MVDTINNFLERLAQARNNPPNVKLSSLISENDYIKLIDFFLKDDPQILKAIESLQPGDSCRFEKNDTGLPRSVVVIRSTHGEFKLILETKSKLADNSKQVLPKASGAFKSGKPAWRVDGVEPTEYFNLVTNLEYISAESGDSVQMLHDNIKLEVEISNINQKEIVSYDKGPLIFKRRGRQISMYSIKGDFTLAQLLNTSTLESDQKHSLLLDLFNGVNALHSQNICHQDLKPENLIIHIDDNSYTLKIIDFGNSIQSEPLAAMGYQSPELQFFYEKGRDNGYQNYFRQNEKFNSYGFQVYTQNPIYFEKLNARDFSIQHKSNDIWALGILTFEILYGRKPTNSLEDIDRISKNPLLGQLLELDRSRRINIEQAIEILKNQISFELITPRPKI